MSIQRADSARASTKAGPPLDLSTPRGVSPQDSMVNQPDEQQVGLAERSAIPDGPAAVARAYPVDLRQGPAALGAGRRFQTRRRRKALIPRWPRARAARLRLSSAWLGFLALPRCRGLEIAAELPYRLKQFCIGSVPQPTPVQVGAHLSHRGDQLPARISGTLSDNVWKAANNSARVSCSLTTDPSHTENWLDSDDSARSQ